MGFDLMSSIQTKELQPAWQIQARNRLAHLSKGGAAERLNRAGDEYGGRLTADLSAYELKGLDRLGDALDAGPSTNGRTFGATQGALADAINPGDPAQREYYKAYRDAALRQLSQAKNTVRAARSTSDAYSGSGLDRAEGRLESDTIAGLAETLGGLIDSDRNTQLAAIPQAMAGAEMRQTIPIEYAQAAGALGDLPRSIQQANYDAQYQEWMRALNDLGIPLDVAAALITYQPPVSVSQHEGILKGIGNSLASGMGGMMGGMGGGGGASAGPPGYSGDYRYQGDGRG
jgi:hypothetical protein